MAEQPPNEPTNVPEVAPSEHIAPEMPPAVDGQIVEPPAPQLTAQPGQPEFIADEKPLTTPRKKTSVPAQSVSGQPRPQRKDRFTLITIASATRSLSITFAASVIAATIFMWFTSPDFLSRNVGPNLALIQQTAEHTVSTPTALPTPIWFNRIGIIAGHSGIATRGRTKGQVDPGAVCPDGFFERQVTESVAKQVVARLQGQGFTVDLLEEWDTRLMSYQAAGLLSLHADSCETFNDGFNHTGFKITNPTERYSARDRDLALVSCMRNNYGQVTGLDFTAGSITVDMTDYHAFHEIAPSTPAAILELGFLSYDRDLLQNHSDKLALGIVNGFLCFLAPNSLPDNPPAPTSAGIPTPTTKP